MHGMRVPLTVNNCAVLYQERCVVFGHLFLCSDPTFFGAGEQYSAIFYICMNTGQGKDIP